MRLRGRLLRNPVSRLTGKSTSWFNILPISLNKDKHFRFRAELGWGLDDFLSSELCAEGRPIGSAGKRPGIAVTQ